MTTTQKQLERVNDFEYDHANRTGVINVKLGNIVDEIKFYYTWDEDIQVTLPSSLESARDAGVEFDLSDLKEEFLELYEQGEEQRKQEEIEQARKRWEHSWVHNVDQPEEEEVEFDIESKEDYVDSVANSRSHYSNRDPRFYVVYRDHRVSISKENVGRSTRKNIKYQVCGSITDHNRRNYGAPENAVEKIVELIDEKIERKERKKAAKQERQRKRAKKKERLEKNFGDLGEITVERKYRRHGGNYHQFYLVIDEDTKYRLDESYKKQDEYTLGSFKTLTAAQVRDILDVLQR